VDSYEGAPIPAGQRSLTLRAQLGSAERTLADEDLTAFRQGFVQYVESIGLKLR
jgi:phenylalanyl-tRNA synthetase beta subunit